LTGKIITKAFIEAMEKKRKLAAWREVSGFDPAKQAKIIREHAIREKEQGPF
jgi:hypothetical protein